MTPKKPCCDLGSNFSDKVFIEASTELLNILDTMESVIDSMIKLRVEMLFIGNMTATSSTTPPVFTRMMWIQENKDIKFNKTNPIHILQLKDKYMQLRLDWKQDPLLIKLEADAMNSAAAAVCELNLTPVP
jgi:hypothetical protein